MFGCRRAILVLFGVWAWKGGVLRRRGWQFGLLLGQYVLWIGCVVMFRRGLGGGCCYFWGCSVGVVSVCILAYMGIKEHFFSLAD